MPVTRTADGDSVWPLAGGMAFVSNAQANETYEPRSLLPSGRQFEISNSEMRAVITEQGAGLRAFSVGGQEFLDGFGEDDYATGTSRGQLLVPWPNRVDGGKYAFGGEEYQLPLNEPERNNAIHGLTRWMNWTVRNRETSKITMELVLHAQPGYPFILSLLQTYELSAHGLKVTNWAQNVGDETLPYGVGSHPYLTVGTDRIDSNYLRIPARKYFENDERLIPQPPPVSVEGTPYDFRQPRQIGATEMDLNFTDLIRDEDGYAKVRFSAPSGQPEVTVFMDGAHEHLQIYTGDDLPTSDQRRRSLTLEPFTCASNALNNGYGLRTLEPGQTFESVWGISIAQNSEAASSTSLER